MDDLDYMGGQHLAHYLKIWADKWSCTGEVKGGTVPLMHHRFIITSNYTPMELFGPDKADSETGAVALSKRTMVEAIERRFTIIEVKSKYEDDDNEEFKSPPVSKRQNTETPQVRKPFMFT